MHCPREINLFVAKRVLRYIRCPIDLAIKMKMGQSFKFESFVDSDSGGLVDDFKSTSGSWNSKKKKTVTQSTAKTELVAAAAAINQRLWLRKIMNALDLKQVATTEVFVDNQVAIVIKKNSFSQCQIILRKICAAGWRNILSL